MEAIDLDALATVTGGRITPAKGPDPALIQGVQQLVQTIEAVGQALVQNQQGQSAR